MVERIKAYCLQKKLFEQGDRVLLGLSGGADSVCLLFVLLALAEEWELSLVPVHVHHHLRGGEADRDQKFCEELCKEQGLSLITVHVDVAGLAKENGWSVEEAGRNARYEAFRRIAKEQNCRKTAVAHHQNDQAETVLFHLFRGSRLNGLSGMKAKAGELVRPLLGVSREEIEEYLKSAGISFCTDSTNQEEEYTRNRIRNQLLPEAERAVPGAGRHIAETADYLERVEHYIETQASELYEQAVSWKRAPEEGEEATEGKRPECAAVSIERLQGVDRLLAERVVYRVLCEAGGAKKDITSAHVELCLSLLKRQTGRSLSLPYGVSVLRNYGELVFSKQEEEVKKWCIPVTAFPTAVFSLGGENGMKFTLSIEETGGNVKEFIEKHGGIPKSTYTKWFDYDRIKDSISFRTPKPDDFLALYADGRGKNVLDVMADAKIPKQERMRTPVLAEGSRVLLVPGVRGSEAYRISDSTKRILIVHGGRKHGRQD